MAETAAPAAPASTPAASTPAADSAAPKLDLKLGGEPAKPSDPAAEAPRDADLVKQVAKASAAERKANAMVADLKRQLETATGSSTEAQQKAALFDAVTKDPSILLDHGVTWDQVLSAVSGKKTEPEDPRHAKTQAELKALQDRIDARDKADADAKTKREKDEDAAHAERGRSNVRALIEKEGQVLDKDGFPRWAIASQDPSNAESVRVAVIDYLTVNKIDASYEDALELVRQGLDQIEAHERKKAAPLLALSAKVAINKDSIATTKPATKERAPLPPDVFTLDASTQSTPPPAGLKNGAPQGPKTRPANF